MQTETKDVKPVSDDEPEPGGVMEFAQFANGLAFLEQIGAVEIVTVPEARTA